MTPRRGTRTGRRVRPGPVPTRSLHPLPNPPQRCIRTRRARSQLQRAPQPGSSSWVHEGTDGLAPRHSRNTGTRFRQAFASHTSAELTYRWYPAFLSLTGPMSAGQLPCGHAAGSARPAERESVHRSACLTDDSCRSSRVPWRFRSAVRQLRSAIGPRPPPASRYSSRYLATRCRE